MNRAEANDILSMQKLGIGKFSASTINAALAATGDLTVLQVLLPQKKVPDAMDVPGQIRVWRSPVAAGNSRVSA